MALCNPQHFKVRDYIQFSGFEVQRNNILEVALFVESRFVELSADTEQVCIEVDGKSIHLGDFVFKAHDGEIMVIPKKLFNIMFDEISDEEAIAIADTVWAYSMMSENQKELFDDDGK